MSVEIKEIVPDINDIVKDVVESVPDTIEIVPGINVEMMRDTVVENNDDMSINISQENIEAFAIDWDKLGTYRKGTTADILGYSFFLMLAEEKETLNLLDRVFVIAVVILAVVVLKWMLPSIIKWTCTKTKKQKNRSETGSR